VQIAKNTDSHRLRHRTGFLPYFFPSFAASHFDMEVSFRLEETLQRLKRLEQIRASKPIPVWNNLVEDLLIPQGSRHGVNLRDSVRVAPIEVDMVRLDDDTYRYLVSLDDNQFRVNAKGYLKRWETWSTVVNGRLTCDLHYFNLLVKSLVYTISSIAVLISLLIVLNLASFFTGAFWPGQLIMELVVNPASLLMIVPLIWILLLVWLWINDVVLRAHLRRKHLLTRIEDTMLFPMTDAGSLTGLKEDVADWEEDSLQVKATIRNDF
jgi:hypothetical protein